MLALTAPSAGVSAPDRGAPLGWLILLPLGCLILLQGLFALMDVAPISSGGLADTDAYMRMVRVLDLHESGNWFDARLPRVHPPAGHVQHWTRPLDALLLGGGEVLAPWLGFRAGLHLWGLLISPVLLALAVPAIVWALRPFLDRDARLLVALAFVLQPSIQAYTIVGRPDHHSLLLLLFVVQLGLAVRLVIAPERRHAWLAGATAALALWISPEALVAIGASLGVLGLYWLSGEPAMARASRDTLVALAVTLALAVVLERGPDQLAVIENDRLSLLHVALFALIAAFWALVVRFDVAAGGPSPRQRQAAPRAWTGVARRGAIAAGGVLAVALLMALLFPSLGDGPLGPVDPLYRDLRLEHIVEFQPLVPGDWLAAGRYGEIAHRVIRIMGIVFLALPFLAWSLARTRAAGQRAWVTIACHLALFLPLALAEVRFATYAQALLVIPYGALIGTVLEQMGATRRLSAGQLSLVRPPVVVAALFWPLFVSQALPQASIATAGRACPLERIAPVLTNLAGGAPKTILTYTDYAPELLYRTPHRVLSIPNHRPQPGFAATFRALRATDPALARQEVARFGVDWVFLCPSAAEQRLFVPAGDHARTLYEQLVAGEPPVWLRALALPAAIAGDARLYAVVGATATATDAPPEGS